MRKNAFLVLIIFLTSTTLLISQNQNKDKITKRNIQQIQDSSIVVPVTISVKAFEEKINAAKG